MISSDEFIFVTLWLLTRKVEFELLGSGQLYSTTLQDLILLQISSHAFPNCIYN
jgi:hypothetical protein